MNEPIDPSPTAIAGGEGLTPVGPWSVHPTYSPANDAPSRAVSQPGAPAWTPATPGAPVWTPVTPSGYPVPPTAARTAWAALGPNPAIPLPPPFVLASTPVAEPLTGVAPAAPLARRSRTAEVALLLAAFVATAGVAFAIGRLSASESASAVPRVAALAGLRVDGAEVAPGAALFAPEIDRTTETSSSAADAADGAALPASDGVALRAADGALADGASLAGLSDTTDATRGAEGMAAGPLEGDPRAMGGDGQPLPVDLPGGFEGGPPGAMAGIAFGGLVGSISAIDDGGLTLATPAGESRSITVDASTLYRNQASIEASDLSPGDRVRIAYERGRPSPLGADLDTATGSDATADQLTPAEGAAQVTLIPAGSPASRLPGVTEGTLLSVVEDGIVVQTATGETRQVSTSDDTTYVRQEIIEAGLLKAGDRVAVQLPFSGPPGQADTATEGSIAATDPTVAEQVTLLTDAES